MKTSRWALMSLVLTCAVSTTSAQTPAAPVRPTAQAPKASQDDLIAKRDAKLKLPVFNRADAKWTFDYDAARAEAKKTGKLLFVYFTRSYAK